MPFWVWRCLYNLLRVPGDGLINDFTFFFTGIMSLFVSISDAVFLVTSFSIFDHSDWLT